MLKDDVARSMTNLRDDLREMAADFEALKQALPRDSEAYGKVLIIWTKFCGMLAGAETLGSAVLAMRMTHQVEGDPVFTQPGSRPSRPTYADRQCAAAHDSLD